MRQNEWRPSLRLVATKGQPKPILPYEDILGIGIILQISRTVGRCRMNEYREEKGLRILSPLLSWKLLELQLKEMPI